MHMHEYNVFLMQRVMHEEAARRRAQAELRRLALESRRPRWSDRLSGLFSRLALPSFSRMRGERPCPPCPDAANLPIA